MAVADGLLLRSTTIDPDEVTPMRLFPFVFALAITPALAMAQTTTPLPDWVTLPFTNVTSHFAEATIVVAQEPGKIHVYSSFTRTWSTLTTKSARPTYTGYDDHVVIQDGPLFWGFSTRFAKFKAMPVPGGTLVPSKAQSWSSVILNGRDSYHFSTLVGEWTRMPFASSPSVVTARLVVVLSDQGTTAAVSAHFGNYVPVQTKGTVTIDSRGLCGIARDSQHVHCFSAYRNRWTSVPVSDNAVVTNPPSRASYIVIQDGNNVTFYSAMTGTALTVAVPPAAVLTLSDDVAVITVPNSSMVQAYSGITGKLDTKGIPVARTVTVRRYLATFEHTGGVDVFSAPLGKFATTLDGSYTVVSDLSVAAATKGTTPAHAYSALTNRWSPVPASLPNATVHPTWCSVCIVDPAGGLHGFSAQTGQWASLQAPVADATFQTGAMFVARSGARLDTFNPRLTVWRTVDTGTPVKSVTCFDQALLAERGADLWAYCLFSDHWSKRTLASTPLGTQVRDELLIAYDATTLHVFGASDQLSNVAIFPYYWRVLARGGPLTYHLAGHANDASLFLLNVNSTDISLPFGRLRVDPAGAIVFPMPPLPAEGILRLPLGVPDDPSLVGVTLWAQALVIDKSSIYLTNANPMTVF